MLYYDFNINEVLFEEDIISKYGNHILTEHNSIKSVEIVSGGNGYENDLEFPKIYDNVIVTGENPAQNAICSVTVDVNGSVIDLKITSGGTGYNIGDNLSISGVPFTDSQTDAVFLTVTSLKTTEDQLRESNIYPIIDKKEIPEGWKENPIASIEELINGGPIYTHDETHAWKICRIYKDECELSAYQKVHQKYFDEIEPLWKK
jgi:hypothetical protein